jgi:hypothetical protein
MRSEDLQNQALVQTIHPATFDRVGACMDGPSDARGKMRILTGGSIAIMCPALPTRHHDRWPRWSPRSSPKHEGGFESRCTNRVLWIVDRSSSHSALSPGTRSQSRTIDLYPSSANSIPRRMAIVVLEHPPLAEAIDKTAIGIFPLCINR